MVAMVVGGRPLQSRLWASLTKRLNVNDPLEKATRSNLLTLWTVWSSTSFRLPIGTSIAKLVGLQGGLVVLGEVDCDTSLRRKS